MIRAVLDTNAIVSGVGWGGPPGAVLDAALAGHFEIVTSLTLLDQLRRVLGYPKLQAVIGQDRAGSNVLSSQTGTTNLVASNAEHARTGAVPRRSAVRPASGVCCSS